MSHRTSFSVSYNTVLLWGGEGATHTPNLYLEMWEKWDRREK